MEFDAKLRGYAVPEWQAAYVRYDALKALIKRYAAELEASAKQEEQQGEWQQPQDLRRVNVPTPGDYRTAHMPTTEHFVPKSAAGVPEGEIVQRVRRKAIEEFNALLEAEVEKVERHFWEKLSTVKDRLQAVEEELCLLVLQSRGRKLQLSRRGRGGDPERHGGSNSFIARSWHGHSYSSGDPFFDGAHASEKKHLRTSSGKRRKTLGSPVSGGMLERRTPCVSPVGHASEGSDGDHTSDDAGEARSPASAAETLNATERSRLQGSVAVFGRRHRHRSERSTNSETAHRGVDGKALTCNIEGEAHALEREALVAHLRRLQRVIVSVLDIFENLQGFANLNLICVYKILKKRDKKLGTQLLRGSFSYYESRLSALVVPKALKASAVASQSRRLYFSMGCVCTLFVNVLILASRKASNPKFREETLIAYLPVYRVVFECSFVTMACAFSMACMEAYGVNYKFLLDIDPKSQVDSTTIFGLATLQQLLFLFSFALFLLDYKFAAFGSEGWIRPVLVGIPYYLRLCQCICRYRARKGDAQTQRLHLLNCGKYIAGILVIICNSLPWESFGVSPYSMCLIWVSSYVCGTIYMFFWDVKVDWGLMPDPDHFLRAAGRSMYPSWMYQSIAVGNLIGRVTWAITLMPMSFSSLGSHLLNLVISVVEISRRAAWVVLRLENEHISNSSKYRATLWVSSAG
eukprot:XP_028354578.1 uncharacterized protein LOC112062859 [Physeter catodon]